MNESIRHDVLCAIAVLEKRFNIKPDEDAIAASAIST
jgi:hypothetical protein